MTNKKVLIPAALILIVTIGIIFGGREELKGAGFIHGIQKPLLIIGSVAQSDRIQNVVDIAKLSDIDFSPVGSLPTFGFDAKPQYLKLRVFNLENTPVSKILEVKNPILNICNLYEIHGNAAQVLYTSGDENDFSDRPIQHINFQFPIDIEPNSSREFILKVSANGEQLQVPIGLWSAPEIAVRDEKDRLLRGIYFGIILFVLLFNLFLYVIIKERSTLYYVFYVFALLMLQLSLGGFAHRYFWPDNVYLTNIANPLFASLSIFALIRFVQLFLNLKSFYPKLNKTLHIMAHIVAINCLIALIYNPITFRISVWDPLESTCRHASLSIL